MVAPSREPFVPVAFAPDSDTARRYADALDAAGIEAHIRIEDGAHLSPTGSAYGSLTSGEPFVYPVLVSRVQRRAARRVISPIVATGAATTLTARTVLMTVAFVIGTVLLVALAALLRGDL
ncbi:MAG: hypothetical protein U0360_04260 [Dehalococcoidia bacterium]